MKQLMKCGLAILGCALIAWPAVGMATEIKVGGDTVKIDEGGVSIGGGSIEVSPDGIKVPGVTVGTGSDSETQPNGRSVTGQVFTGSDFRNTDYSGHNFSGSQFIGVDFRGADLSNANFTGASLQGVDFRQANLNGAIFTESQLQGVDFRTADASDACFIRANLIGNDFGEAKLKGAVFTDAKRIGNDFGGVDLSAAIWKGSRVCSNSKAEAPRPKVTDATAITSALAKGKDARVDLTVNFEFDSDRIKAEGHAQVLEIANALKSDELTNQRVLIEGHTDNVGNDNYNLDLSYRRAISVMRALTEQYGVDGNGRVQVKGFGEARPVADNDSEAGRAINRRVTLVNLGNG